MDIKEESNERRIPIPGEYGHPIPRELLFRELGFNGPFSRHSVGKKIVSHTLATKAVHTMCTKEKIEKRKFKLPAGARTTFHLAFSADGSKVASCHGDHNIYVCNVSTGEVCSMLTGHPRTPWCVTFHPTQNDILASGCLSGHVRVWDLKGGCETLVTDSGTVIASLAFHPTVRLLAIATFNEIIFWDWSNPTPLARCSTENTKEKVRLVRFDRLGKNLITGITNYPNAPYPDHISTASASENNERLLFRPNILSRSSPRSIIRHIYGDSRATQQNNLLDNNVNMEVIVPVDDQIIEDVEQPMDIAQLEVMAAEAESAIERRNLAEANGTLNDRQDRFHESYQQLVTHYQDLVTHYQAFLRSRIPRLLETSRAMREEQNLPEVEPPPITINNSIVADISPLSFETNSPVSLLQQQQQQQQQQLPAEILAVLTDDDSNSSSSMLQHTAASIHNINHNISDVTQVMTTAPLTIIDDNGESMIIDDEIPGPSSASLIVEAPILDPAAFLEQQIIIENSNASSISIISGEEDDGNDSNSNSRIENENETSSTPTTIAGGATTSSTTDSEDNNTNGENNNDLRSIEALAQNIMEMQNLCTQARRDVPTNDSRVSTDTPQHIVELQSIRRHLEVLQEQTRDLQSSIRATLTSLARGSLDAIRSHIEEQNTSGTPGDHVVSSQPGQVQSIGAGAGQQSVTNSGGGILRTATGRSNNHQNNNQNSTTSGSTPGSVRRTVGVGVNQNNQDVELIFISSTPGGGLRETAYNRTSFGINYETMERPTPSRPSVVINNNNANNNGNNNNNSNEPTPGPSRDYLRNASNAESVQERRRIIRENLNNYIESEHTRNCPFSRDIPSRPPSRMRCLAELGEQPSLTVWPTNETGIETSTRSFRNVSSSSSSNNNNNVNLANDRSNISVSNTTTSTTTSRNTSNNNQSAAAAAADSNNNSLQQSTLNSFQRLLGSSLPQLNYWSNSGNFWVSNDLGVSIFLALRLCGEFNSANANIREAQGETWQRTFASGLALVPPSVRQGQRQSFKRRRTVCYHPGTNRFFSLRPSPFDEFRSNLLISQSSSNNNNNNNNNPGPSNSNPINNNPGGPGPEPGTSSSNNNNNNNAARGTREIPSRLGGHFVRIFFMRMGEEYIPVFSNLTENNEPIDETRDGFQPHVYLFPIGLFCIGSNWELGTQTVGIYWPPSREEDEALVETRRNESLVPIYNSTSMSGTGFNISRYRIDYDTNNLRIVLPRGYLSIVQPGLSILDAVTTVANLPRPRDLHGVVYIDYIAPFLDRLERLFGHRMRRGSSSNAFYSNGSAGSALRLSSMTGRLPLYQVRNPEPQQPNNNSSDIVILNTSPNNEETDGPLSATTNSNSSTGSSSLSGGRRLTRNNNNESNNSNNNSNSNGSSSSNNINRRLTVGIMSENDNDNIRPGGAEQVIFRRRHNSNSAPEDNSLNSLSLAEDSLPDIFVRSDRLTNRLRQELLSRANSEESAAAGGAGSQNDQTRRVIRLAVDTATAEVLRRQSHHNPYISRAIESRIERVLNERGNRGQSTLSGSGPGSGQSSPLDPLEVSNNNNSSENQNQQQIQMGGINNNNNNTNTPSSSRMEDLQLRITNAYVAWARASGRGSGGDQSVLSHSGTQTTASINSTTTTPTPTLNLNSSLNSSNSAGSGSSSVRSLASFYNQNRRRGFTNTNSISPAEVNININTSTNNTSTTDNDEPQARMARLSPTLTLPSPLPQQIGITIGREDGSQVSASYTNSEWAQNQSQVAQQMRQRHDAAVQQREHYYSATRRINTPYGERWVIRRQRQQQLPTSSSANNSTTNTNNNSNNNNNSTTDGGALDDSVGNSAGSARTRATTNTNSGSSGSSSGTPHPNIFRYHNEGDGRRIPITIRTQFSGGRDGSSPNFHQYYHRFQQGFEGGTGAGSGAGDGIGNNNNGGRFYPGYIPEILITPRARPPTYYTMDAATTAFLSSRIQKWDFSNFFIPDLTKRDESIVVRECSLHSDACLDISNDSDFLGVLQPSDNGSYSSVGIYSLRDETLGQILNSYHFDQNTVSVSISPSCDYIVVGYAGRGPLYRVVQQSRIIGQILSLTRDGDRIKLVPVKELVADSQNSLMSINCMHWVPIPGYGIIYGTNIGELVLIY